MTKHIEKVTCRFCKQELVRSVCGNIVDYRHSSGTYLCDMYQLANKLVMNPWELKLGK